MYPNPWIRKHSTLRQVIDKLLSINSNNTKKFDAMLNKKKNDGMPAAAGPANNGKSRKRWISHFRRRRRRATVLRFSNLYGSHERRPQSSYLHHVHIYIYIIHTHDQQRSGRTGWLPDTGGVVVGGYRSSAAENARRTDLRRESSGFRIVRPVRLLRGRVELARWWVTDFHYYYIFTLRLNFRSLGAQNVFYWKTRYRKSHDYGRTAVVFKLSLSSVRGVRW